MGFVGFSLFGWMPNWIFRLGNEDDRSYFLKCIGVCDDEYDLAEIGFEEQYEHIEKLIFEKLLNDDPVIVERENFHVQSLRPAKARKTVIMTAATVIPTPSSTRNIPRC